MVRVGEVHIQRLHGHGSDIRRNNETVDYRGVGLSFVKRPHQGVGGGGIQLKDRLPSLWQRLIGKVENGKKLVLDALDQKNDNVSKVMKSGVNQLLC